MTKATIDRIRALLSNDVSGAEDNLARARMEFRRDDDAARARQYGQSGRTRGEIYDRYTADHASATAALAEFTAEHGS